jgi:hypothetical protein
MSTPTYKGQAQASVATRGGLLARLGAMFGGAGTPRYRGDGQPSPGSGGFFGIATPAYKVTEAAQAADGAQAQAGEAAQIERPLIVVDPDALAAGKIAVIVPRDLCAPRDPCSVQGVEGVTQQ